MINFVKKNLKTILFLALVILIAVIFLGKKNQDEGISKYTVDYGSIVDTLVLSGEVEPVQEVEMSFPVSGIVESVYKSAGESVFKGEKILELDNRTLRADLADALANLDLQKAQSKISNAELDKEVENAYSKLLSDGLIAYTKNEDSENNPPEVYGKYLGTEEGEYKIDIKFSNYGSRYAFDYYGMEKGETVIVFYKPVPLGTKGLYLKFEEGEVSAGDSWTVSIPNVQSDTYLENLNNYKSALASRDAAEGSNVSKDINDAKIKQAEASVQKIRAQIAERTLYSPFDGIVGNIDIKQGEIVSAGETVTKILSSGSFEVVVEVPEIDVVSLSSGMPAEIFLDAYSNSEPFIGQVISIDPAETKVDGVSVYKSRVGFSVYDENIRSGMSADVHIIKNKKDGVLRLPKRFINKDEIGEYVIVSDGELKNNVYITTGIIGTDGFVEVLSGLNQGDIIIGEFKE